MTIIPMINKHLITFKYTSIIYLIYFFSFFIYADENLERLTLPDGFQINVFAENLNSPRQITQTANGHIIVGSKKGDEIIALIDKEMDGFAENKIVIANGLQNPTGVAFHNGDFVSLTEQDAYNNIVRTTIEAMASVLGGWK